jgi:LysR family transcriptional regulator (chromosome initiation inhibitor)
MASRAVAARWFPGGPTPEALGSAPMLVFDRDDAKQHDYLAARAPGAEPPQTMVPSSSDFVAAIGLGFGWAMVADLQRAGAPGLVELEPDFVDDVALYLQRWRLRSASLDRLADAIVAGARERLRR